MADHSQDRPRDDAPLATRRHPEGGNRDSDPLSIAKAGEFAVVTIKAPIDKISAFCADPANWPVFMKDVRTIQRLNDDSLLWTAGEDDDTVEWRTDLTKRGHDRPSIGWIPTDDQPVDSRGHIEFQDAGPRGTFATAAIVHRDAGIKGKLKQALFLNDPLVQARRDLRRLKQFFETGEIATAARTRAQLHAELHGTSKG